jgi:DNA-binding NarL/FixJ family response regulator
MQRADANQDVEPGASATQGYCQRGEDHFMQTQSECAEPIVCVCSLHPLAARCLRDAIEAEGARGFKTRMLASLHELMPRSGGELLLLDGCCHEDWPKLAMRWQKSGGTVLVLLPAETTHPGKQLRALFLGVRGVVVTSSSWQSELHRAVNAVLDGGLWISHEVLSEYVKRTSAQSRNRTGGSDPLSYLTAREEQIMSLLLKRDSNKEIGNALGISERTVKYHVSNILQKKQASNRRELLDRTDGFAHLTFLPGWKHEPTEIGSEARVAR